MNLDPWYHNITGFRKRWATRLSDDPEPECRDQPLAEGLDGANESVITSGSSWIEVEAASECSDTTREIDDSQPAAKLPRLGGTAASGQIQTLPLDIRGAVESTIPVKITMPWERGPLASLFGQSWGPYRPLSMTRLPAPIPPRRIILDVEPPKPMSLSQARLRSVRAGQPEDDRSRALHRFKVLILLDPLATRAGRQMTDIAGLCSDEARAIETLKDILSPKSTGTLVKRSGSLWRYAAFLAGRGVTSPFAADEANLYLYLQKLKKEECTSTASVLLEAMRFAHSMFGFLKVTLAELDSPRVKGAAHAMFVQKRARSQAPAIPVDVVKKLVGHAGDPAEEPHVSMIAGQLLKCVFGVGRWSDFRSAGGLEIDEFEGTVMWTMWTADHKTAQTKEAKTRLLPFLGLGYWPGFGDWISTVVDNQRAAGLDQGLPSWNHHSATWNLWLMSSSEATAWLREFAEPVVGPEAAQKLRSHSCKHTLLTWAGGSGLFTREERTMLGHHVEAATKSATTYDHNTMLALRAKVLKMIEMIAVGSYRPDDPPAARLRAMAGSSQDNREHQSEPAESQHIQTTNQISSSDDDGEAEPKEVIEVQREPLPVDAGAYMSGFGTESAA